MDTENLANSEIDHKIEPKKTKLGVFALYTNQKEAETAMKALEKNGFLKDDLSMLAPSLSGHHDFVYHQRTHMLDFAAIGSFIGLVLLGTVTFLFDTRMLFFNSAYDNNFIGLGANPVMAFIGATAGLILGAAIGALVGIGVPISAAHRYGFYLKEGGIVLVVRLKNMAKKDIINRILEKTNGQDINVLDEAQIWSTIIPAKTYTQVF
jgi:hypothetical protein